MPRRPPSGRVGRRRPAPRRRASATASTASSAPRCARPATACWSTRPASSSPARCAGGPRLVKVNRAEAQAARSSARATSRDDALPARPGPVRRRTAGAGARRHARRGRRRRAPGGAALEVLGAGGRRSSTRPAPATASPRRCCSRSSRGEPAEAALAAAAGAAAANAADPLTGHFDPELARELAGRAVVARSAYTAVTPPSASTGARARYTDAMRPVLFQIGDFKFYSFGLMAALALIVPGILLVRPLAQAPRRRRRTSPSSSSSRPASAASSAPASTTSSRTGPRSTNDFWGTRHSAASASPGTAVSSAASSPSWPGPASAASRSASSPTPWRPRSPWATRSAASAASSPATATTASPRGLPWAMGYPHGTVPTPPGVDGPPHAHLRDPHHGAHRLGAVAPGDALRQVGLVDLRLVPRARRPSSASLVEFLRRNPVWFGGLTQPQWVAVGSVIIGVALVLVYGKRPAERIAPETRAARRAAVRA